MNRIHAVALSSVLLVTLSLPAASVAATHSGAGTTGTGSKAVSTPAHTGAMPASAEHKSTTPPKSEHAVKVDINSATKEQLMTLPGINDALADRIMAGRPWKSKDELVQKGVLTKTEFSKVSSHLVAKQAPKEGIAPSSKEKSGTEAK